MCGELRLLMAQKPKKRKEPGAKIRYQDPRFIAALEAVWRETDYMRSKNLEKTLPIWLPAYEAVEGIFREDIRIRLLSISAASIDLISDNGGGFINRDMFLFSQREGTRAYKSNDNAHVEQKNRTHI